jgi:hypothetical protein
VSLLREEEVGIQRALKRHPLEGERNAPTSCIGCHQHGGLRKPGPTTIRKDEARFPDNTRRRVREDFPFDSLWSASSSTELARILSDAQRSP